MNIRFSYDKKFKLKVTLVSICFLSLLLTGCPPETVPKAEYDELAKKSTDEHIKLKKEYDTLDKQYKLAVGKLNNVEIVDRSELVEKIHGLERVITEKEKTREESIKRAYAQGQLALLYNMNVIGYPSEKGVLFKDHFFTFEVYIYGHQMYSFTMETDNKEAPFNKVIGVMSNLNSVIVPWMK